MRQKVHTTHQWSQESYIFTVQKERRIITIPSFKIVGDNNY